MDNKRNTDTLSLRWSPGKTLLTHQELFNARLLDNNSRLSHRLRSHLLLHPWCISKFLPPSCLPPPPAIPPSLPLHVACARSSRCSPTTSLSFFPLIYLFFFPSPNHTLPNFCLPPSISLCLPHLSFCPSVSLSLTVLKMLLGPQCFAPLLSTMINSESVVFCSRQSAASLPRPQAEALAPLDDSGSLQQALANGSRANSIGILLQQHVTEDRWGGRWEWL